MDIRKAFDAVPHKILLRELQHYGIRVTARCLIENYSISHRVVNLSLSTTYCNFLSKPITIGIFQGSILDPLLFFIYVYGLHNAE